MNTSDYKSFHYLENGEVNFSVFSTENTTNTLIPGSYKVDYEGYPREEVILKMDKDQETAKYPFFFVKKDEMDTYFNAFFNAGIKEKIKSLGFYHKGGLLLYGKEGCGKTSITKYYCNKAIKDHNCLVFHIVKPSYIMNIYNFIASIREIQDNPIIIVLDELDVFCKNEGELKTIIDGNLSIHNCLFFGMTNYYDSIPDAIKLRPSRFKYCFEVEGIQSIEVIQQIAKPILENKLNKEEMIIFAEKLKGETLDIIKHKCLDKIMQIEQDKSSIRKKLGF